MENKQNLIYIVEHEQLDQAIPEAVYPHILQLYEPINSLIVWIWFSVYNVNNPNTNT